MLVNCCIAILPSKLRSRPEYIILILASFLLTGAGRCMYTLGRDLPEAVVSQVEKFGHPGIITWWRAAVIIYGHKPGVYTLLVIYAYDPYYTVGRSIEEEEHTPTPHNHHNHYCHGGGTGGGYLVSGG